MADHTILFTVTTRAIAFNTDRLPISVFVSPRLTGSSELGGFPDWVEWTRALSTRGLDLTVATESRTTVASIDTTVLRPDLWEALFNRETLVNSHEFDDYSGRPVISYSVNACLSVLKAVYQDASVSLALPDPPSDFDQELEHERSFSPNRNRLRDLVDGLQVNWDGRRAPGLRADGNFQAGRLVPSGVDSEGLLEFEDGPKPRDLKAAALPFSVFHHMPNPPTRDELQIDPAGLFDFHQALSTLNSYPRLLRALGILFDIDLPLDFVEENQPQSRHLWIDGAALGDGWHTPPTTRSLRTAVVHATGGGQRAFWTASRGTQGSAAPSVLGLLDLPGGGFGFAQLDVDGGMHKAIMAAETIHPTDGHNVKGDAGPQPAPNPEVFDPDATLPALRSGGMTLYADRRAQALLDAIGQSKKFNAAIASGGTNVPLFAEDLVRGYRLDVWDSLTGSWHSLHLRTAQYEVGGVLLDAEPVVEEGFVELAVVQPAPTAEPATKDLYLHEAVARWRGWSLSAPLPFRHLTRYPNADDALPDPKPGDPPDKYEEDQPVTPFSVTSPYRVVGGSLPALRFGVRYRMRARVVDLAGNALELDDEVTDLLTGRFALPQDPEGFAYLRFEPVPAPLVILRDPSAVTEPGSAIHRIVLRTYNSSADLDAAPADTSLADRHIVPPRTSVELGELMGMFDNPLGKPKPDAATWSLVATRDAGGFATTTIPIAGGASQDYPVEPAAGIDPLPHLPDPLSRGAAIRDLPGTGSGVVGRVEPGAGPVGPVTYEALSDPSPRRGSATIVGFGGPAWEERTGFRLSLADPAPGQPDGTPSWDPTNRVLTVYLPKAGLTTVPLTSWVDPRDLRLLGVWQWLREYVDRLDGLPDHQRLQRGADAERVAHVLQRAVEGGHWMLTPPTLLTLVHAVQQPIGQPSFTALNVDRTVNRHASDLQTARARGETDPTELAPITAWRHPGSTYANLLGALKVHGASTARVDIQATWDDRVDDDPADSKWRTEHHTGTTDEQQLRQLRNGYLRAPGAGSRFVGYYDLEHDQIAFVRSGDVAQPERPFPFDLREAAPRHEIGDTKRHVVTYTPTATSRFQEYFPGLEVTRVGTSVVVDVPASARPLAPSVVAVIPTFGWQRQLDTNVKRSVRFGGGLRVYLDRPWYSSGNGELLGVALYDGSSGRLDDALRAKLKPYITQWGMDPIWETAGLDGYPAIYNFPDRLEDDVAVTLEEDAARGTTGEPGRVNVVGFEPLYDEGRRLWFADLTVDLPTDTYMPFVRLALVRYQPHALPDAMISRVVLADFMQLTPDRTATVTADPHHPRAVRVAVSGVGPRGPRATVRREAALSPPRPTRVTLRVQRRDPLVQSDLAWNDVDASVATVTVTADRLLADADPRKTRPDLELWTGTVTFAERPAPGEFRLLIEEREYVSARFAEVISDHVRQPSRVIYAETFLVDDLLTG